LRNRLRRRRSSHSDTPAGGRGPPRRARWSGGDTRRPAHPTDRARTLLRCAASLRPLGLRGEGSVPWSALLCRKPLPAATHAGNAPGVHLRRNHLRVSSTSRLPCPLSDLVWETSSTSFNPSPVHSGPVTRSWETRERSGAHPAGRSQVHRAAAGTRRDEPHSD
jgi:hypothetical protein